MVYLLLVFGFDIHKPPEVIIMYPDSICNNFDRFDGLANAKKFMILLALTIGRSLQITTFPISVIT